VVYHGKPYRFKTDINDLVDGPRDLVDRYFLKPFQVLDLSKIDDEEIRGHMWSSVMMFALKHIFARDMLPYFRAYIPILAAIDKLGGNDLVGLMLQYTMESGEFSDENEFFDMINTTISYQTGEEIMTLAEKLILKGKLEGKLEGELKGKLDMAKKMINEGVDAAFIAKISGLSLEQVKKL
jgi:hypothetical protein